MNPGPGVNPGIPGAGPGFNPGLPAPNDPGFSPGPAPTPRSETSSSSSSTTPATTGTSRVSWVLLIVFVGGGLFLLLAIAGVAGVIWMISTAPRGATGAPRARKRSRSEYEPI